MYTCIEYLPTWTPFFNHSWLFLASQDCKSTGCVLGSASPLQSVESQTFLRGGIGFSSQLLHLFSQKSEICSLNSTLDLAAHCGYLRHYRPSRRRQRIIDKCRQVTGITPAPSAAESEPSAILGWRPSLLTWRPLLLGTNKEKEERLVNACYYRLN